MAKKVTKIGVSDEPEGKSKDSDLEPTAASPPAVSIEETMAQFETASDDAGGEKDEHIRVITNTEADTDEPSESITVKRKSAVAIKQEVTPDKPEDISEHPSPLSRKKVIAPLDHSKIKEEETPEPELAAEAEQPPSDDTEGKAEKVEVRPQQAVEPEPSSGVGPQPQELAAEAGQPPSDDTEGKAEKVEVRSQQAVEPEPSSGVGPQLQEEVQTNISPTETAESAAAAETPEVTKKPPVSAFDAQNFNSSEDGDNPTVQDTVPTDEPIATSQFSADELVKPPGSRDYQISRKNIKRTPKSIKQKKQITLTQVIVLVTVIYFCAGAIYLYLR